MQSTSGTVSDARRWVILATSLLAAMATTCLASGVAFLIPRLHADGMSLPAASVLASAPMVGMVATTVLWGWALDRVGERRILLLSLSLTVVATAATTVASALGAPTWGLWLGLFTGGAVSASTNGASGRIVVGWFPAHQRGTAMGIRQMAQPLGVGVTGLTVPVLAQHFGATAGFAVFVVVAVIALAATALTIVDPPHSTSAAGTDAPNPYRRTNFLVRVHAVSVLLVVPQVALWTFVPAWLMIARHWPPKVQSRRGTNPRPAPNPDPTQSQTQAHALQRRQRRNWSAGRHPTTQPSCQPLARWWPTKCQPRRRQPGAAAGRIAPTHQQRRAPCPSDAKNVLRPSHLQGPVVSTNTVPALDSDEAVGPTRSATKMRPV